MVLGIPVVWYKVKVKDVDVILPSVNVNYLCGYQTDALSVDPAGDLDMEQPLSFLGADPVLNAIGRSGAEGNGCIGRAALKFFYRLSDGEETLSHSQWERGFYTVRALLTGNVEGNTCLRGILNMNASSRKEDFALYFSAMHLRYDAEPDEAAYLSFVRPKW